MIKKIACVLLMSLAMVLIWNASYNAGYKTAQHNYSKGWREGYSFGIIRVMEALHNIKNAEVHYGNVTIDADYIALTDVLFLYSGDLEYAIKVEEGASNIMISNNLMYSN